MSVPGGCELGPRPLDLHLQALRLLGAEIREEPGGIVCQAARLRGAEIPLTLPSVGATENAMIAACAAEGETVIYNAAREPEIETLQEYLRLLGAQISGAGSPVIRVNGFTPREHAGRASAGPDCGGYLFVLHGLCRRRCGPAGRGTGPHGAGAGDPGGHGLCGDGPARSCTYRRIRPSAGAGGCGYPAIPGVSHRRRPASHGGMPEGNGAGRVY